MTIFLNSDASRLIVQNTVIPVPPCLRKSVMYYAALLAIAEEMKGNQ